MPLWLVSFEAVLRAELFRISEGSVVCLESLEICVIIVRIVGCAEGSSSGLGSSFGSTPYLLCNFRKVAQFSKPEFPCQHCPWPASLWCYSDVQI